MEIVLFGVFLLPMAWILDRSGLSGRANLPNLFGLCLKVSLVMSVILTLLANLDQGSRMQQRSSPMRQIQPGQTYQRW